uniref:Protein kinase domain-containing protein n=1 Tax=Panagrolaimus sp. ES5 TaxID=591445 RepID=A0AC34FB78_9BILA
MCDFGSAIFFDKDVVGKKVKNFTGTSTFASLFAHENREQGMLSDIQSLLWSIEYLQSTNLDIIDDSPPFNVIKLLKEKMIKDKSYFESLPPVAKELFEIVCTADPAGPPPFDKLFKVLEAAAKELQFDLHDVGFHLGDKEVELAKLKFEQKNQQKLEKDHGEKKIKRRSKSKSRR